MANGSIHSMYRYGIEAHRIVAYTYDAAYHCTYHAEKRHGLEPGKTWVREDALDTEGNPVHPFFSVDQDIDTVEVCDDNLDEIICLVCGMIDSERKQFDQCWNCHSDWITNTHDHPNWSHDIAYGPCTKPVNTFG